MLPAQTNNDEAVWFVDPSGNQGQVWKTSRAYGHRGLVEYVPFVVLAHAQLEFRAQVVDIIRIKTEETEYFLFRMQVRFPRGAICRICYRAPR